MRIFAKKERTLWKRLGIFCSVILFVGLLVAFNQGMHALEATNEEENMKFVEDSVRRATVHCYAIEGQYPINLNYLVDNYGLRYDEKKYSVFYTGIGGNLMPNIDVVKN